MIRPVKLGGRGLSPAPAGRPKGSRLAYRRPAVAGHVDAVSEREGDVMFEGWIHAAGLPAVQIATEARSGECSLGVIVADSPRPDLIDHGMGDGRHGFRLIIPRERLRAAARGAARLDVVIGCFDSNVEIGCATVTP